jgi:2-polyprenyl-3-methyl-5-hydroxy-6-metoxy-1,4-benzoquinol methylase
MIHDHDQKTHLKELHDDVPPNYYDTSMKTNLIQRFYHGRRFKNLCNLASKTEGTLLDVGCDGGTLLEKIAAKVAPSRVVALDLSGEAVRYTLGKRPDFAGLIADAEALPFRDGVFEAIFCSEVMEHIERPQTLMAEIKRCLSPDGYAVVAVPHENMLYKFVWFLWTRFGKGKVWRHAHVQEFSPASLDELITGAGFRKVKDSYMLLRMIRAVRIAPA